METVTLSTKGQLVIPARIRKALRLKAGNQLQVSIEKGSIVIRPQLDAQWKPLNPAGARLRAADLSRPVVLSDARGRR